MTNQHLTQQGDGNTKPDPSTDPNLNPNSNAETDASPDTPDPSGAPASQPKKPISEARLRANRQNAQKSTGPKTARGKGHSRRNALKHGLLVKQLLFSEDGKPINEELHQLWEGLHEQYGNDVRTHLLIEGLVVDYWRQRQSLVVERRLFQATDWPFCPQGQIPNLQRYNTASQRALLKNLELLDEQQPPASESDEDEGEGETPTPRPEDPPPALESTSGLTLVAAEQGSSECGSQSEHEAASVEGSTPTGDVEEAA